MVIHCLFCTALVEILKQLSFHPGNDDLLTYIIDMCFRRFLSKDLAPNFSTYAQQTQLYLDAQFVTDLYAEVIGSIAQHRFALVKRRFHIEFTRLNLKHGMSPLFNPNNTIASSSNSNSNNNISSGSSVNLNVASSTMALSSSGGGAGNASSQTSVGTETSAAVVGIDQASQQTVNGSALNPVSISSSSSNLANATAFISHTSTNTIKLLMGMKHFRIKMVPIEDFEASFQFLNECAQIFCDTKDKDIKHTLAGLFVEILVPITGQVKNEVNIPCLKSFVDTLYTHALELSAKSKHRLATIPLLTCLLCVSQRQFFLNSWFQFTQLCIQQFKSREPMLARISLEAVLRLVWVYTIRIRCEKSSDTNQRLLFIAQNLFPKGSKVCQPKEMPASVFVKIIGYIAYEKLDFAMKEIIYDLLSIDSNQNSSNSSASIEQLTMNASGQLNTAANSLLMPTTVSFNSAFRISRDNLILLPVRMEIGLRAFIFIADTLQQQKELGQVLPPNMPPTFNIPAHDTLSLYLSNSSPTTGKIF